MPVDLGLFLGWAAGRAAWDSVPDVAIAVTSLVVIAVVGVVDGPAGGAQPARGAGTLEPSGPSPAIDPPVSAGPLAPPPAVTDHRRGPTTMARSSTDHPPRTNPLRIGRIGADHLQVFIRPVHGSTELSDLVDRLERLIDVGYDAIDVVFEAAPGEPDGADDPSGTVTTGGTTGTPTDATAPAPARP